MCENPESECVELREGECRYVVDLNEGVATLTGLDYSVTGEYEVPRELGGFCVAGIADQAISHRLSSVTIPESVCAIEQSSFHFARGLSSIHVDSANPCYTSEDGVLFGKKRRRLIRCPPNRSGVYTIPAGVVEIADDAFYDCCLLTDVILPRGLTKIGDGAFHGCSGITAIELPDRVKHIGGCVFSGCVNLATIRVGEKNAAYRVKNGVLFDKGLKSLVLMPCNTTGEYTIPASVEYVEENALAVCPGLTAFRVEEGGDSFSSIDGVLFSKDMCVLLRFPPAMVGLCKIPASVKMISSDAFLDCCFLMACEVEGNNADYSSADGVLFSKDMKALIRFPGEWDGYYQVPDGVERIKTDAFYACGGLTGIGLSASVYDIGWSIFARACKVLSAIDMEMGNGRFRCVDGVLFNEDMRVLIRCPEGRTGTYTIPKTVWWIKGFAFNGCAKLERIEVPTSVADVGVGVWDGVVGEIVYEAG